jgi:hypothetical protein
LERILTQYRINENIGKKTKLDWVLPCWKVLRKLSKYESLEDAAHGDGSSDSTRSAKRAAEQGSNERLVRRKTKGVMVADKNKKIEKLMTQIKQWSEEAVDGINYGLRRIAAITNAHEKA